MVEKNSDKQFKSKVILPNKMGKPMPILDEDLNRSDDDDDFDDAVVDRTESSAKVKYLPPSVIKDIEQKNVARKLAGLPPILTRIRLCLICHAKFQSAGNRTCGCTNRIAGVIAGREII